jgi:hypothetical protein
MCHLAGIQRQTPGWRVTQHEKTLRRNGLESQYP